MVGAFGFGVEIELRQLVVLAGEEQRPCQFVERARGGERFHPGLGVSGDRLVEPRAVAVADAARIVSVERGKLDEIGALVGSELDGFAMGLFGFIQIHAFGVELAGFVVRPDPAQAQVGGGVLRLFCDDLPADFHGIRARAVREIAVGKTKRRIRARAGILQQHVESFFRFAFRNEFFAGVDERDAIACLAGELLYHLSTDHRAFLRRVARARAGEPVAHG